MKKIILASLVGTVFLCGQAQAEFSASLGYMYTDADKGVEGLSTNLHGANLKGSWESNIGLGVIGSASYTSTSKDRKRHGVTYEEELSYASFLVGPSLRATEWLTPYALVGIGWGEYKEEERWNSGKNRREESTSKSGFAFGGGMQIHPFQVGKGRILVDLSYERAFLKERNTNSFAIGAGYRF